MERRRYPRVESVNLVSMGKIHEDTPVGVGRTLEISAGGALLEMAAPYPRHTVFQLDLALGNELLPVKAEIRHIHAEDDGSYKVGVHFLQLEPAARQRLESHLEARLPGEQE